jgi:hypothetical protein
LPYVTLRAVRKEMAIMTVVRRLFHWLAVSLGCVGVLACATGLIGVCLMSSRLSVGADGVFETIDDSLIDVQERVSRTQDRVEAAKITTAGIEQTLKDWAARETRERVGSRPGVEGKVERLAGSLRQADHWLQVSESSIRIVQQALKLGSSSGAPVKTGSVDRLLEAVSSVQVQLTQAMEAVEGIQERTSEAGDEKSLRDRVDQAVQVALKLIATLGSIESRLDGISDRLSETKFKIQDLEAKTHRWILIATVGVGLLIMWMGSGQVFMCLHGWKSLRRSAQPSGSDEPSA